MYAFKLQDVSGYTCHSLMQWAVAGVKEKAKESANDDEKRSSKRIKQQQQGSQAHQSLNVQQHLR